MAESNKQGTVTLETAAHAQRGTESQYVYVRVTGTMLTFVQNLSYHVHITCLPDCHSGKQMG